MSSSGSTRRRRPPEPPSLDSRRAAVPLGGASSRPTDVSGLGRRRRGAGHLDAPSGAGRIQGPPRPAGPALRRTARQEAFGPRREAPAARGRHGLGPLPHGERHDAEDQWRAEARHRDLAGRGADPDPDLLTAAQAPDGAGAAARAPEARALGEREELARALGVVSHERRVVSHERRVEKLADGRVWGQRRRPRAGQRGAGNVIGETDPTREGGGGDGDGATTRGHERAMGPVAGVRTPRAAA